ncbi:MAG: DegT/DnrJ/EryC1/StrS family aminotransferase [Mariprofundaceae bacterium]
MDKCTLGDWPQFAEDEISAVCDVLRSGKANYWTGDQCRLFESEFSTYIGMPHAISLANGTLALELALHALGIGPGDEVIVPARTFIATASAVVMRGAVPVVVDVDRDAQGISADAIRKAITSRTRAVIVVHLGGWPCAMGELMALATKHGLKVIEDCAQALGAVYGGQLVGSFGDAAAFSFCQDKIMSTGGEGGMLLLRDEAAWRRAWAFKDHGKSYDAVHHQTHPPGHRWYCHSFGTNWRLTEMQAAIGRRQLAKLPEWLNIRRSHAAILQKRLSGLAGLRVPTPSEHVRPAYYRFYAFVQPERLRRGWNRDRIVEEITSRGAPCFQGSCGEIYREKAFASAGLQPPERLAVARELHEQSLASLVHPTLSAESIKETARTAEQVMLEATG